MDLSAEGAGPAGPGTHPFRQTSNASMCNVSQRHLLTRPIQGVASRGAPDSWRRGWWYWCTPVSGHPTANGGPDLDPQSTSCELYLALHSLVQAWRKRLFAFLFCKAARLQGMRCFFVRKNAPGRGVCAQCSVKLVFLAYVVTWNPSTPGTPLAGHYLGSHLPTYPHPGQLLGNLVLSKPRAHPHQ